MLRCLIKEESMQICVMYSFNILNEKLTHFFMVLWTLSHENEKSEKNTKNSIILSFNKDFYVFQKVSHKFTHFFTPKFIRILRVKI